MHICYSWPNLWQTSRASGKKRETKVFISKSRVLKEHEAFEEMNNKLVF